MGYPGRPARRAMPRSSWPTASRRECLSSTARVSLAYPGPALVDVVVNPDEPPMPASISYEQAKGFASSFLHGQPRRASIVSTLFRDGLRQFRAGS